MLDKETRKILFLEIHREIWDSAYGAIETIRGSRLAGDSLGYPPQPDGFLTTDEIRALRKLAPSDSACSAVKKLVADACAQAFFHVFALMDAVGDPELSDVEEWLGIDLTAANDDTLESKSLMLHDELFDSYWKFKEVYDRAHEEQS